jgi:hypothetical protein
MDCLLRWPLPHPRVLTSIWFRPRWKGNKTQCTTMQQYIDIYGGPDYPIHWQYSNITTTVWMTFMFGGVMPILYPISALSFFIQYVSDSLCYAYRNKKPPMYDDSITNNALLWMKWGAVPLNLCMTFWAYSNHQMFDNSPVPM